MYQIQPLRSATFVIVVFCMVLTGSAAPAATEVNSCGQAYSGAGYLAADLNCTGFPTDAVTLSGGSLDLRGFTLTGGDARAVLCDKSCKVFSSPAGGMIVGSGGTAVRGVGVAINVNLTVRDVTIDGNANGITSNTGKVDARDVQILNTFATAVNGSKVKLRDVAIVDAAAGVFGSVVKIVDSTISNAALGIDGSERVILKTAVVTGGSGDGITHGGPLKLTDSSVTGRGGAGISVGAGQRVRLIRSNVSGNSAQGIVMSAGVGRLTAKESTISNNVLEGIAYPGRIKVVGNSDVSGNGLDGLNTGVGVGCERVTIRDSTLTGNGTDASCGVAQTCADLATCVLPNLSSTTCDTSYDTNSGFPGTSWGVCALD